MTPEMSNKKETLAGMALPHAKLCLLSRCDSNFLYAFGLCKCARKNGRNDGRMEEKSQEVYISVCVERPLVADFNQTL